MYECGQYVYIYISRTCKQTFPINPSPPAFQNNKPPPREPGQNRLSLIDFDSNLLSDADSRRHPKGIRQAFKTMT